MADTHTHTHTHLLLAAKAIVKRRLETGTYLLLVHTHLLLAVGVKAKKKLEADTHTHRLLVAGAVVKRRLKAHTHMLLDQRKRGGLKAVYTFSLLAFRWMKSRLEGCTWTPPPRLRADRKEV